MCNSKETSDGGKDQAVTRQHLCLKIMLPIRIMVDGVPGQSFLEAAGVRFLGPVERDELFQYAEVPPGWAVQETADPRFTKLLDNKGRERGSIFYKPDFHDRCANMSLTCRFDIRRDFDLEESEGNIAWHVTDCEKVIYSTPPVKLLADMSMQGAQAEQARDVAIQWLDTHYPNWCNCNAYWD
jgi:hypothetical protein